MARSIANNGFLPNLIGVLAHSPAALETYVTVGAINAATSLGLAEREVVQLTEAAIHGCDFCLAGHGALMRRSGDARLDAVADFTRAVIDRRGAVSDGEYRDFLAHGYGAQQALEVILGVSLATLCNFANTLAQTDVNRELQPFLPARP